MTLTVKYEGQGCKVPLCCNTELHRPHHGLPDHTFRAEATIPSSSLASSFKCFRTLLQPNSTSNKYLAGCSRHWTDAQLNNGSVLTVLYETISLHLLCLSLAQWISPTSMSSLSHIVSTDIRPNTVWWNNKHRSVCLVELTVYHDTLFNEAASQKISTWTSSNFYLYP